MIEYHNLYIHLVLTTVHRAKLISQKHRSRIERYISGIISNTGSLMYAIYANPDHVHILVSKNPKISENELVDAIMNGSAKFVNENKLCGSPFEWQDTSAAFSVSKSHIDKTCKYILEQPLHHKKLSFEEEYKAFIKHYQTGEKESPSS